MKTHIKILLFLPALVAGLGLIPAGRVMAQTFTTLHSFTNSDGANPAAGLILSGNTLYGTAAFGGSSSSGDGTVFAVNTNGTGFTNLYSFTATSGSFPNTNSDGSGPAAGLILSGNTLYGTAYGGGSWGNGTVFAVNTDGTGFTNLHSFTAFSSLYPYGNSDGGNPYCGLILSGNTLYGTAERGGSWVNGTVFAVNTDGTGFTNLHSFKAFLYPYPYGNSDGAYPSAGLILSGNTLYGTAYGGGRWGNGTVVAVNTDGTGFTNLHSFTAFSSLYPYGNSDGAYPEAGLILSGNTLYGTAYRGGSWGNGTVFSLSFAPQLTIIRSAANVILTWPTNAAGFTYAGFTLQSTTNLVSPAVWNTVSPAPVIVNGQNAVTNPISGTQQFYRLNQPAIPSGMALIPAGSFTMGDNLDGESDATPISVTVSAFYMDVNLVSYSQWQSVYNWATNHEYGFVNAGSGNAANHPVQTVDWFDIQ